MEVISLAALIIRIIGATADTYTGVKTLQEAKREIWSKVSQQVAKGLSTGLITPKYDAKWLQTALNHHGASLKVDGIYGEATREAVMAFQREKGSLVIDGWAGLQTLAALAIAETPMKALED